MKIKVLKNTAASGKHLKVGDVVSAPDEVSNSDANFLIATGKAESYTPPKAKKKAPVNREIDAGDLETR